MGNRISLNSNSSGVVGAQFANAEGVQSQATSRALILPTVAAAVDATERAEHDGSGSGMVGIELPEIKGQVSMEQASNAAGRLLFNGAASLAKALGAQPISSVPSSSPRPTQPQQPQSPFGNAVNVSVEALALYGMLLYMKQMSNNVKLDLKSAQGSSAAQAGQFKRKEDAWLKERKEQSKATHHSLIGEIIKDVLTMVAAVSDIAEGIGELVAFDPQGLASVASGVAQAVAASLQIAAQATHNPQEAAKLNKIADDINYAAIGLSVIGGCINVGRSFSAAGKIGDAASDAVSGAFSMTDDELDSALSAGMGSFRDEPGVEMDVLSSSAEGADSEFVRAADDGAVVKGENAEDTVKVKSDDDDSVSARSTLTKDDFEKQIDVATNRMMESLEKEFKGTPFETGLARDAARTRLRGVIEKAVEGALKSGDVDEIGAKAAENASSVKETFGAATTVRQQGTWATRLVKASVKASSGAVDGATEITTANEANAAGKADIDQKKADFDLLMLQNLENLALKNMRTDTNNESKAREHMVSITGGCVNAIQAAGRAL